MASCILTVLDSNFRKCARFVEFQSWHTSFYDFTNLSKTVMFLLMEVLPPICGVEIHRICITCFLGLPVVAPSFLALFFSSWIGHGAKHPAVWTLGFYKATFQSSHFAGISTQEVFWCPSLVISIPMNDHSPPYGNGCFMSVSFCHDPWIEGWVVSSMAILVNRSKVEGILQNNPLHTKTRWWFETSFIVTLT